MKTEKIENQDPDLEKIRHYRGTWKNFFDFWKKKGVEVDPYKGTILKYPTEKIYTGRKNVHQDFGTYDKAKKIQENMKHIPTFESFVNENIDVKYWSDYNDDAGVQGQSKHYSDKSTDFEDTFEDAVTEWNQEADGAENRIKGAQIQKIKKLAQEFFKKAGWISVNVVQAMIMQES